MKWTTDDVTLLNKTYLDWKVTIEEMADMLGRTQASVRAKARSLGMQRPIPSDMTLEGWARGSLRSRIAHPPYI